MSKIEYTTSFNLTLKKSECIDLLEILNALELDRGNMRANDKWQSLNPHSMESVKTIRTEIREALKLKTESI